MTDIVIYGASDQGECTVDVVERQGKDRIIGFLDDRLAPGTDVCGYPVLGPGRALRAIRAEHRIDGAIVAIGDNFARRRAVDQLLALDPTLEFATAIDPAATVGGGVTIGAGSVLMAGVVVNRGARLGAHTLLCVRSSLDHHSTLGDFASLAPTAATGGRVTIGASAAICIGATVNHGLTVGDHTVIGAGSTVVRNIGDRVLAMGVPCRTVRPRSVDEPYL